MNNKKGNCVGIDLGTTFSAVSFWNAASERAEVIEHDVTGMPCLPSWVAFLPSGSLVGQSAKEQGDENCSNSLFDSKRLIGREWGDAAVAEERTRGLWPFVVEAGPDGRQIRYRVRHLGREELKSPEEIAMHILKELKRIAETRLGGPVTHAVITVPAAFNKSQKEATKVAGELAGLSVLSVIPEPTAAALYFGYLHKDDHEQESILVFDFGGGTFDVTILQRTGADFKVLATVGDAHLGGEDVDQILVDICRVHFNRQHAGKDPIDSNAAMWRLRAACEAAKRDLSSQDQVLIQVEGLFQGCDLSYRLTRPAFERAIRPLVDRLQAPVLKALEIAHAKDPTFRSPKQVILVGGSTKIPLVRKRVKEWLDIDSLVTNVPVDTIVAQGAALQAHVLFHNKGLRTTPRKRKSMPGLPARYIPVLYDVSPLSTGIAVVNGEMSVIIKSQSTVPCSETRDYTTSADNQESIRIEIFEGENLMAQDNFRVGDFLVHGLPKRPKGALKIPVTFRLDANGLLKVTASVHGTDVSGDCEVRVFNHALSVAEKKEIVAKEKEDVQRSREIKEQQERLRRIIFSVEHLQRSVSSARLLEQIEDLQGKLELDQEFDLDGSTQLLDSIISQVHSGKGYRDLMALYTKNAKKLESKRSMSRQSRDSLRHLADILKETPDEDCSFYYRVRPVMDEIKAFSVSGSKKAV